MSILVLFDIDGTILLAHGAGRRSVHQAMQEVFDATVPADHPFDGKTDPQIVRELGMIAGVPEAVIDAKMSAALERYYSHLEADITFAPHTVELLPGVLDILDALEAAEGVILGLLTGNIEMGAALKLRAVDIAPERFVVGAYGSDAPVRPALPAIAQSRAVAHLGVDVPGSQIVIIGDTPHDLTCGRAIGARAIGVETGRYSAAQLHPYGPLAVFQDLADTNAVLRTILSVRAERAA
jgi:phosphoglycolate phosphatase